MCDEEYQLALTVWKATGCKNLGDYSHVYLACDVTQLADVFQNFRVMCKDYYDLDPSHYISLPSFAWDACLRYTGAELEFIHDPELYAFFESGIRGGISVISGRYAKANNKYMDDYDPSAPSSYIPYWDANNL